MKMEKYSIYEIADNEYVALPAREEGPFDSPDALVEIDVEGAWVPGTQQDLRVALSERAIKKFHANAK